MNYQKQLDEMVEKYIDKIRKVPKKDRDVGLRRVLREMSHEIAKVVRDGTLRFHEARRDGKPIPADLAALPLFKQEPPYVPSPPPGAPRPIKG
jgi:hypothetical protein